MKTDADRVLEVKLRHGTLRALRKCINGPIEGVVSRRTRREHGPVFKGGRCEACWAQKLGNDVTRYWQQKARGDS